MSRVAKLVFYALLGASVAMTTTLVSEDALAGKPKKVEKPAAPTSAPTVKIREGIEIKPNGLHWGMNSRQVAQLYEKVIEEDFAPLYKKAEPGPQTQRIDAAVAEAKAAFVRSKILFADLPTGIDSTALKGEYTYRNGESLMQLTRRGRGTRHFFFIKDKLWKIYDERALGEKSPVGKDFEEAKRRVAQKYKVPGRVIEPDFDAGRYFQEVDWQDDKTHFRLLDRSGNKLAGLVYEDRATLDQLSSLRTQVDKKAEGVDPAVQALMRPAAPPPGPKDDEKNKDKDKNKKKK